MKRSVVPFGNGGICLRLIERSDLDMTLSWRNRDEARVWFKSSACLTREQHYAWFDRYADRDDDFLFIVESCGRPVGQASVYAVDWQAGSAEVGRFLVAPGEGGKGYIGRACGELICFCAVTLGLGRIFLEVMDANERAIRVYRRNDFSEECRYDGLIRMGRLLTLSGKA